MWGCGGWFRPWQTGVQGPRAQVQGLGKPLVVSALRGKELTWGQISHGGH